MRPFPFRLSSPKVEGVLQVSKWIKSPVLLDTSEMRELLEALAPLVFCVGSEPVSSAEALFSPEQFLVLYAEYIAQIRSGQTPHEKPFRRAFSSMMSRSAQSFYAVTVGTDRYLIKPTCPVIQLQSHNFFYSTSDRKFLPMVLSKESVSWGIQFSYPQLFQDLATAQIGRVTSSEEFPNTELFQTLQRWLRSHTLPTPFIASGEKINATIRIGKRCLAWINSHPQLLEKGLQVEVSEKLEQRQGT